MCHFIVTTHPTLNKIFRLSKWKTKYNHQFVDKINCASLNVNWLSWLDKIYRIKYKAVTLLLTISSKYKIWLYTYLLNLMDNQMDSSLSNKEVNIFDISTNKRQWPLKIVVTIGVGHYLIQFCSINAY